MTAKQLGWRRLVGIVLSCGVLCGALLNATEAKAEERTKERAAAGDDVVEVFARAERGEPLRYVAIGGSITQGSGPGWVGDWLADTFPGSHVTVVNSGISGTGSALGIFRIERDVISHQPDLVAIEYCVNDGGLPDEEAIRFIETMVVRLKSSPRPPAIVILEAAARSGVNLSRHRRVARHYGLLEVDFQAAVDAHLAAGGLPWTTLFGDDVHPNRAGHAFYADVMRQTLEPLVQRAKSRSRKPGPRVADLPAPLSAAPLLLDARMAPLYSHRDRTGDWRSEATPPVYWNRFFQGLLSAERPGATLRIPFRGTAAGVFILMSEDHGSFFINVDGRLPSQVFANSRNGFTTVLTETNLPPGEHMLNVVLPQAPLDDADTAFKSTGPVKLGYLLVAGETRPADGERAPEGPFGVEVLQSLRFETLPAANWSWTGPFPVPATPDGRPPMDAITAIGIPFLSELEHSPEAANNLDWRPVTSEGGRVDFRALTGSDAPAVVYARTEWTSEHAGPAVLAVDADYFAHLWLNGERVLSLEGPHRVPVFLPVKLRAGANTFLMKIGAGSAGFSTRLRLAPHAETPSQPGR